MVGLQFTVTFRYGGIYTDTITLRLYKSLDDSILVNITRSEC